MQAQAAAVAIRPRDQHLCAFREQETAQEAEAGYIIDLTEPER